MRFRVGALVVLAVAGGLIAWLALRDSGSSSSKDSATAVSVDQIANLAAEVKHPVFWVGPRDGFSYELSRNANGAIFIRYLPAGVEIGSKDPYLTVATYPFARAFEALEAVAGERGSTRVNLPGGGLAVISSSYPQSIHAAYPNVDYQIEVFDPSPQQAIAAARQLAAVTSSPAANTPKPVAASVATLKSLPKSLKHPVYWVGPRAGYTYELTLGQDGKVFIRYLPLGVQVGAAEGYLTVATYPFPGAFAALEALTGQPSEQAINLLGNGLAVLNTKSPTSIHLAFKGSDYQIEVFDPSAARVKQIVTSNQVKTIG